MKLITTTILLFLSFQALGLQSFDVKSPNQEHFIINEKSFINGDCNDLTNGDQINFLTYSYLTEKALNCYSVKIFIMNKHKICSLLCE